MDKYALFSVSNKDGVAEFARKVSDAGFKILATSGTRKFLEESGVSVESVEDYTASAELLNGRVKTLHPKIHAGLLAKSDNAEHAKQLQEREIHNISLAVVNLYPFLEGRKNEDEQPLEKMVELIDIGGPTMARAAAKNCKYVVPLMFAEDFKRVENYLDDLSKFPISERLTLARRIFSFISSYDLEISKYLCEQEEDSTKISGEVLVKKQELRYGENPHQDGVFYTSINKSEVLPWKKLGGKSLSYNNILDLDASLSLIRDFEGFDKPVIGLLKHCNPCGVAFCNSQVGALTKAQSGDKRSHFGGIVVANTELKKETAEKIVESFYELVVAPKFSDDAIEVLNSKKSLRKIEFDYSLLGDDICRSVIGGYLVQKVDSANIDVNEYEVKVGSLDSQETIRDLNMAMKVCKNVKSNAIVIVKDGNVVGVGAGQMSRVDSAELAVTRAKFNGHDLSGAVVASDAFFPFPDGVELLLKNGVKAVIVPTGAKRDEEVFAVVEKYNATLVRSEYRHFKH